MPNAATQMVFQKNSTRTWFSFDAAIRQLGGASIISTGADMQLGRGETIEDTAKVLSRMVDAIMIRANRHQDIEALAEASDVPVIKPGPSTSANKLHRDYSHAGAQFGYT